MAKAFIMCLWISILCGPVFSQQQKKFEAQGYQETSTPVGKFFSSKLTLENKFPFSDLVAVGDIVYLSGLVGIDEKGKLVKGGVIAETHAIFRQLKQHLASQKLDLGHVVKCFVMLDDINHWGSFNKVYTRYFKPPYPIRSAMGVYGD